MPECCARLSSQNPVVQKNADRHTDDAKRISDQVSLHIVALGDDAYGKVIAVALADGRSDGVAYPDRGSAVSHQRMRERDYCFIKIPLGGMPVCDAESFLWVHRMARSRDIATPDRDQPGGGLALIPAVTQEDFARQVEMMRRITGGKI
jgi:hypothetical protein